MPSYLFDVLNFVAIYFSLTTTVPVIHGCTLHKYEYDPGFSNVTVKFVSGGPGGACPEGQSHPELMYLSVPSIL